MRRVAVFGNAGGGKSTLSHRLAELSGLPLFVVDKMQFMAGGAQVPQEVLQAHADLLRRNEWIIDGFGNAATAWEQFSAADTLIFVDLPLFTHYWGVTKRFVKGFVKGPLGWPENSPLWSSTLSSYRVISLCHRRLTPRYRQLVIEAATSKRVYHLRSVAQIHSFLDAMDAEFQVR